MRDAHKFLKMHGTRGVVSLPVPTSCSVEDPVLFTRDAVTIYDAQSAGEYEVMNTT